jgi:hypothetical protein
MSSYYCMCVPILRHETEEWPLTSTRLLWPLTSTRLLRPLTSTRLLWPLTSTRLLTRLSLAHLAYNLHTTTCVSSYVCIHPNASTHVCADTAEWARTRQVRATALCRAYACTSTLCRADASTRRHERRGRQRSPTLSHSLPVPPGPSVFPRRGRQKSRRSRVLSRMRFDGKTRTSATTLVRASVSYKRALAYPTRAVCDSLVSLPHLVSPGCPVICVSSYYYVCARARIHVCSYC